jgi:hypothetical protein
MYKLTATHSVSKRGRYNYKYHTVNKYDLILKYFEILSYNVSEWLITCISRTTNCYITKRCNLAQIPRDFKL